MKYFVLKFLLLQCFLLFSCITSAQADTKLQNLRLKLANSQHDTLRMLVYTDIWIYFENDVKNIDSALVYAMKAEALAEKLPNFPKRVKIWNLLGILYRKIGDSKGINDTIMPIKYYQRCIEDAKKFGNEELILKATYNLNDSYNSAGKHYLFHKGALNLIIYILKKSTLNKLDSLVLRKSYKDLALSLDYDMGSKKFNDYLTMSKKFASKKGRDFEQLCLLEFENYAIIWQKEEKQRLLDTYQEYKKLINITAYHDRLSLYLAEYYYRIKEYQKAFQISNEFSIRAYTDIGDSINLKVAHLGLKYLIMGKSAFMLQRNKEAITYLQQALSYSSKVQDRNSMRYEKYTVLLYLSKAYKKVGNYKQALVYNEQADDIYKQFHSEQSQALFAEYDVQIENIKQDKKVQEAHTFALLKEQEAIIQKKQKNILILISFLALAGAFLAIYFYLRKKQFSEQLEANNLIISQQATSLNESNKLKDKIFALLSHDLRSPVNQLLTKIESTAPNSILTVKKELKDVQDILNNVLYWASMQLRGITPINKELPLKALVDSIENEYHIILKEKKITFLNSIDSKLIIKTDENYLKIIIRNLISNAIKFTEQTGFIQIYCKENEDNIVIGLKDTGIGIPDDKLKNIYNYPEPSIGTSHETGNGIGLSLSMEIAKKLNGNLKINSIEQKGTVVQLILYK